MTKTSAVLFILFFSLLFKLEEPVSDLFFVPALNICVNYPSETSFYSGMKDLLLPDFSYLFILTVLESEVQLAYRLYRIIESSVSLMKCWMAITGSFCC